MPGGNERLRTARELRGWTQQYVANKVGAEPFTVSRWERGIQPPGGYFRHQLCELFQMSALELGLVTEDTPTESTPRAAPAFWHVPYQRNPCFTDRRGMVHQLRERLIKDGGKAPHQAISGLGGIGKTQLALAYAYEYRETYQAVFWVHASMQAQLLGGLAHIGRLVQVPEAKKREPKPQYLVNEALYWLQTHRDWLLIFDNVEEILDTGDTDQVEKDLTLDRILAQVQDGHVLLTTRSQQMARLAHNLLLEEMLPEEGAQLLLLRSRQPSSPDVLQAASPGDQEAVRALAQLLGGLPLALEQARAYMETTGCGIEGYIHLYEACRQQLLAAVPEGSQLKKDYHESVATTWLISFRQVEQQSQTASDLLKLYAYLAPDAIPEAIILEGASTLEGTLHSLAGDVFHFNDACRVLLNYSLIKRNAQESFISMHRLVQAVLQENMTVAERLFWARQAIRGLEHVFSATRAAGQSTERYLPHARICAVFVKQLHLQGEEVGHLLEMAADTVYKGGWYTQAVPLYHRALGAYTDLYGEDAPRVLRLLRRSADVHVKLGAYPFATQLYQVVKQRLEHRFGPNHPDILLCLNKLASVQGRINLAAAQDTNQQALDRYDQAQVPSDPELQAMTYMVAGELAIRVSQFALAEQCYMTALQIHEQKTGLAHPNVAECFTQIGLCYLLQKRFEGAELILQRALEMHQQRLGNDHPELVDGLIYLGMLFWQQHTYDQAEARYLQALTIVRQKLGSYHKTVVHILHDLAQVAAEQHKNEEAEGYLREALDLAIHAVGSESLEYLSLLMAYEEILQQCGRTEEAEQYQQRIKDLKHRFRTRGPLSQATLHNANGSLSAIHMWHSMPLRDEL